MLFTIRFFKRSGKWYMDKPHAVDGVSHMSEVCENIRLAYPNNHFIIEVVAAADKEAENIFYPCLLL